VKEIKEGSNLQKFLPPAGLPLSLRNQRWEGELADEKRFWFFDLFAKKEMFCFC